MCKDKQLAFALNRLTFRINKYQQQNTNLYIPKFVKKNNARYLRLFGTHFVSRNK
jgi:hypothetical protein